jgi:glc operon protein GlcG
MTTARSDLIHHVSISYSLANEAIAATMQYARRVDVVLSIVVVDVGGHVVSAGRMDGAPFITIEVARGKAFASAATGGQPGSALAQRFQENPMVWGNVAALETPLFPAAGSLPIFVEGQLVGAIAASGAISATDEAAVLAGITAIRASSTR